MISLKEWMTPKGYPIRAEGNGPTTLHQYRCPSCKTWWMQVPKSGCCLNRILTAIRHKAELAWKEAEHA